MFLLYYSNNALYFNSYYQQDLSFKMNKNTSTYNLKRRCINCFKIHNYLTINRLLE